MRSQQEKGVKIESQDFHDEDNLIEREEDSINSKSQPNSLRIWVVVGVLLLVSLAVKMLTQTQSDSLHTQAIRQPAIEQTKPPPLRQGQLRMQNPPQIEVSEEQMSLAKRIESIIAGVEDREAEGPVSADEKAKRVYAGEIHYSRIPEQYWEHRILMVKAMGMNSLSVYVMWNYHQVERGVFDYQTGNRNLPSFLDLAKKHNMRVLIRPGPYICGEWDFGGLPARLLGISNMKIRVADATYLKEVRLYFESLAPILQKYVKNVGGPIQFLQIENELGSFSDQKVYTDSLIYMWKDLKVECQYYYEDAAEYAHYHYWPGAAIGLSGATNPYEYSRFRNDQTQMLKPDTLIFGGEIYTGWMTHWQEPRWSGNSYEKFQQEITGLIKNQFQFSLYMAHGGTNFGLTAGANAGIHNIDYEPMITSYDYDATISEDGKVTPKFNLVADLMSQYVRGPSITIPEEIPSIEIPVIQPSLVASLMAHLPEAKVTNSSQAFFFEHKELEMYNQGIVVYQTFIKQGQYSLQMKIHDVGILFQDGEAISSMVRDKVSEFKEYLNCQKQKCKLQLLVEAMGHNNYGRNQQKDKKGLISYNMTRYSPKQKIAQTWNIYTVPIDNNIFNWKKIDSTATYPAAFEATFDIEGQLGDTYLDMRGYEKGYLWVNGHNLGRYWSKGPQYRLYCPGVWLKKRGNRVVVLEMFSSKAQGIQGFTERAEKTID